MDDEDLVEVAQDYASRHAVEVREILGSGIHGIVYVVESKADPGRRALKLHRDAEAYMREKTVYEQFGLQWETVQARIFFGSLSARVGGYF